MFVQKQFQLLCHIIILTLQAFMVSLGGGKLANKMILSRRRQLVLSIFLVGCWVYSYFLTRPFISVYYELGEADRLVNGIDDGPIRKIVLGAVVCANPGNHHPRDEALVMIKSAAISAKLFNVTHLEVHLFMEHYKDKKFLEKASKDLHFFDADDVKVNIIFHWAFEPVPEQFRHHLLYDKRFFRCTFVRLFFPAFLKDLDSLLYIDSDVIFTGSLVEIWRHLGKMGDEQFIGLTADYEPENPSQSDWTGEIPYPPPKGVQAGIMLMNLTRMRRARWEEKVLEIYRGYWNRVKLNDQMILNILMYFNSGGLHLLPCQFNFRSAHCVRGFYCQSSKQDPYGIHIIHGSTSQFSSNKAFTEILQSYKKVRRCMKDSDNKRDIWSEIMFLYLEFTTKVRLAHEELDLRKELMIPIRSAYEAKDVQENPGHKQCDGNISSLFFTNFFPVGE